MKKFVLVMALLFIPLTSNVAWADTTPTDTSTSVSTPFIPASVYPVGTKLDFSSPSNSEVDCNWGFAGCQNGQPNINEPLFHSSPQDTFNRTGGWQQNGRYRDPNHHWAVWQTVYNTYDNPHDAKLAAVDFKYALVNFGFTRSSPLALATVQAPHFKVWTISLQGAYTLYMACFYSKTSEVEALAEVKASHKALNKLTLDTFAAQFTYINNTIINR